MQKTFRLAAALGRFKKHIFQVCVLSILVFVGAWGHQNHWSFAAHDADSLTRHPAASVHGEIVAAAGHSASKSGTQSPDEPLRAAARIKFPSARSVLELGIRPTPVERRSVTREVTASGVVAYEPSRLAQLSARVPGTVWRLEKQVGQSIHAGDTLAVIDATAVGQAKAEFLRSIANVRLREKAYERLKSFENGVIALKQVEEAETELQKARVDRFNAWQTLISLGLGINLEQWRELPMKELESRLKFLGLPESIVSQLDPNVTTASLLPIYAPFDGIVIGHDLTIGEVVSPTQSRFEIADVSKMWIVLNVREQDADDLQLGQKIVFTAGSATVASTLSWLSTAVDDRTRTVEVRCEVDNPEIMNRVGQPMGKRLLRANLFGIAKIAVQENASALVVPIKAVQRNGSTQVVFVPIDDTTLEARVVRVGIATSEVVEILEGLSEADSIIVEGSHILKAELARSAGPKPPP